MDTVGGDKFSDTQSSSASSGVKLTQDDTAGYRFNDEEPSSEFDDIQSLQSRNTFAEMTGFGAGHRAFANIESVDSISNVGFGRAFSEKSEPIRHAHAHRSEHATYMDGQDDVTALQIFDRRAEGRKKDLCPETQAALVAGVAALGDDRKGSKKKFRASKKGGKKLEGVKKEKSGTKGEDAV